MTTHLRYSTFKYSRRTRPTSDTDSTENATTPASLRPSLTRAHTYHCPPSSPTTLARLASLTLCIALRRATSRSSFSTRPPADTITRSALHCGVLFPFRSRLILVLKSSALVLGYPCGSTRRSWRARRWSRAPAAVAAVPSESGYSRAMPRARAIASDTFVFFRAVVWFLAGETRGLEVLVLLLSCSPRWLSLIMGTYCSISRAWASLSHLSRRPVEIATHAVRASSRSPSAFSR